MSTFTLIRVDGHLAGPWAVGSAGHDTDRNIPVLLDPHTRQPVLPATTLVGALRSHLSDPVGWLGPEPATEGDDSAPAPSRLWALGTSLDGQVQVGTVHRTAIDGWRGAAAGTTLRSESIVDADHTRFRWALCHDGAIDTGLLDQLARWRTEIGARRTIGLGTLAVGRVTAVTVDLTDVAALTWWLTARDNWLLAGTDDSASAPPGEVTVREAGGDDTARETETWAWRIVDPLHVGTGEFAEDGQAAGGRSTRIRDYRAAPAGGSPDATERLEIPGSAWKGIFRHRVCMVLRSCGATDTGVDDVVRVLFGHHGDRDRSTGRGDRRRGLLRFGPSIVAVTETLTRTHVAIDRISGGAADSKLFAVRSVPVGSGRLRIGGINALPDPVRNLLHHVIWDLHEGVIGVGAFTTRGYGTIALTDPLPATQPVSVSAITGWATDVLTSDGSAAATSSGKVVPR